MEKTDTLESECVTNNDSPPATFHGSDNDLRVVESQPSATRVSLHQRSLTPVFVDTQLSSTTTTATSPRQRVLTLHEYRKRQRGPSLPVVGGSRRVKRKPATRDLTAVERVQTHAPSSPLPSPQRLLESSPSPWPSEHVRGPATTDFDTFTGLRSEDSIPSFTSLLDSYCDRSSSAPPFAFSLSDQSRSIYSGEASHSLPKGRARYFKPSKRLPRPVTQPPPRFSHASITPSPLRLASSKHSSRLAARRNTDITSPLALSKLSFPCPPSPPHDPSSLDCKVAPSPAAGSRNFTDHEGLTRRTVLKIGDISFDVVNPHNSLSLRSIETPGDADADLSDYFETHSEPATTIRNHKRNIPSNRTMESGQTFRTANEDSSSTDRSGPQRLTTPPRAMYGDLTSAHHAITSRNGPSSSEKSSRLELPLPPHPVALSPHKSLPMHISSSSSNLSNYRPEPLNVQKMNRTPSVLRRVTSIFRRTRYAEDEESKCSTSGSNSIALLDARAISPPRRAPSIHLQWFQTASQDKRNSRSAPYFYTSEDQSFGFPGHHVRHSNSQPEIRHSAYVSNYPDTEAGGSRIFDTDSVAPDWSSPELDYSQEVHDQSRLWQFADKPDAEAQRMSLLREGTADSIVERYAQNDNTLDSIVGKYYKEGTPGSAPSLTTLSTAGEEHESSPAIERGRSIGNARRTSISSPGLGRFHFGLSHDHRPGEGQSQTPSRISGLRSLPVSTGGPPSGPLPALPSGELRPPNPPFVQQGGSAVTENDISYGSSYGDTRNLLLMSSSSRQRNDSAEKSKLASILPDELVKASTTPLPAKPSEKEALNKSVYSSKPMSRSHLTNVMDRHHEQYSPMEQDWEDESVHENRLNDKNRWSGGVFILKNKSLQSLGENEEPAPSTPNDPFHNAQRRTEAIPKMWQEVSSASLTRQPQTNISNHQPSSSMKTTTSDDPDEWETVADTSRADMANDEIDEHGGSIFKFAGEKLPVLPQGTADLGNQRYQHRYHSPKKPNASILMPSYDFRDGAGFPHHNALTPTRNVTPRHYPRPLGSHPHPFNNPPPQFGLANSPSTPSIHEFDVDIMQKYHRKQENEKQTPECKIQSKINSDNRKQHPFSTTSTAFDVKSPTPCVPPLRTERSSDFDYDPDWVPYPSPTQKNPRLFTKTSLSTIPSSTRDASERMSSSTNHSAIAKSQRVNSFAKFTVTGPKTNLTGTPRGTGMREVGSSEADNSSPGMRFSSSPMSPNSNASLHMIYNDVQEQADLDEDYYNIPNSSPPGSAGIPRISTQKSNGSILSIADNRLTSPIETPSKCRQLDNDPISPCLRSSSDTSNGNRANEGRQRRYQHLRAPSKKWAPLYTKEQHILINEASPPQPSRKSSRRSVHGQKGLMPMRLGTITPIQDKPEEIEGSIQMVELSNASRVRNQSPHPTEVRPRSASVMGSTKTDAPLIARPSRHNTVCTRPSTVDTPSLKHIPPTPSQLAERRPREKMISLIVFAICLFFPPALIMYGFGCMDSLVTTATKGELLGFGPTEKRAARYVGITLTVALVVAIVVFMVAFTVKV